MGHVPHLPWALARTGGAVGQGGTPSLVGGARAVGRAQDLRFPSHVTEGNWGPWPWACGDVPCRLCHVPEQTVQAKANGQVGGGSAVTLSVWCSSYKSLSPAVTRTCSAGLRGTNPGSGQGCWGQLCGLGTAETAGPRGQEVLGFCTKPGFRAAGVGAWFLVSTEVPCAPSVTLGPGRKEERRAGMV